MPAENGPRSEPVPDFGKLIVYLEPDKRLSTGKEIVFQYNPEQLTRRLDSRAATSTSNPGNAGSARADVLKVGGPPIETITLAVVLDALDQRKSDSKDSKGENKVIHYDGLGPFLATLEMLLYPTTLRVQQNEKLAQGGEVQIDEVNLPLVLLEWGATRQVPVKITSFSITEEAYDAKLNPIRAKVDLSLQVLTYLEFERSTQGYEAFISYQRQKEELAGKHPSAIAQPVPPLRKG